MKSLLSKFCLSIVMLITSIHADAALGDTTYVTVFDKLSISRNGNFDTTVHFDHSKTYKKVIALYTLGKESCPTGTQYCGSWDYTTLLYLLESGPLGAVQIGKVITPYATTNSGSSRLFPYTWTHTYPIDVSDYANLLDSNQDIRYKFDGYSFGFTLTLKFMLIEGTPPRSVTGMNKIYSGYYPYGKVSNPMNTLLTPQTVHFPLGTTKAIVRTNISGHGSYANTGCSEFCPNKFKVLQNNNQIAYNDIWRECGSINLMTQTGTWPFDRGNWCPGEKVHNIDNVMTNVVAGDSAKVQIVMDSVFAYDNASSAQYIMETHVIDYGAMNFTTNATLQYVKRPTMEDQVERYNASCESPIIVVRNNGSSTITSMEIQYGLSQGTPITYNWSGTIPAETEAEVTLPFLDEIHKTSDDTTFVVRISKVNNTTDQDITDNTFRTQFRKVNSWPTKIQIITFANMQTVGSVSENGWEIRSANGNLIKERKNFLPQTVYRDTVDFTFGCYTFEAFDASCDGMAAWYFQYYTPNPGNGYITIKALDGTSTATIIPEHYYKGDFGCGFKANFKVDWLTSTHSINNGNNDELKIYPNPTSDILNIDLSSSENNLIYKILDTKGQIVLTGNLIGSAIDVQSLSSGIYVLEIQGEQMFWTKSFSKK